MLRITFECIEQGRAPCTPNGSQTSRAPPFLHSEMEKGSHVNEVTLTALTALMRQVSISSAPLQGTGLFLRTSKTFRIRQAVSNCVVTR